MAFVILGVILLVMNWTGIGPPAAWNFDLLGDLWKFAWPFVAAVVWWGWSDSTGRTQRKAIERMEERKVDRRDKALEALGMGGKGRRGKRAPRPHPGDAAVRTGAGALEQSQDRDLGRRQDPRP
ncbi:MAG: TIGR04438 family Trp-rich protein [Betaproteobacteria bacterium]|nr:TIGR04438 family Trp-rich protein [Betaproteobacteria bacterium]MCC6247169.1 TIGR04438 family Trp-rich protein [Rubrivivax sp.]MCL4699846.1 TIGR04438 family Trp-rich protein [Burkholderiaceae bacterium]